MGYRGTNHCAESDLRLRAPGVELILSSQTLISQTFRDFSGLPYLGSILEFFSLVWFSMVTIGNLVIIRLV